MSKEDILHQLMSLKEDEQLGNYRLGLAGSYARGTNGAASDIDIVVDSDGIPVSYMERMKAYFKDLDVDVLCLGLLKKEDMELDDFLKEMGLPINNDSVYKNVLREVVWCE